MPLSLDRTHREGETSSISVERRAAMKAKQDVANLEPYKEMQDRLVERSPERLTDRQIQTDTDKQADEYRQTERRTDRRTDRHIGRLEPYT